MSRAKQTLHISRMTIWGLNNYSHWGIEVQGERTVSVMSLGVADGARVCVNPPTQSARQTDGRTDGHNPNSF